SGDMVLYGHVDPFGNTSDRVLTFAYANSLYGSGAGDHTNAIHRGGANPLDAAILKHEVPNISGFRKLDAIPFDFERRRQSVIVESGGERLLICKGAPEGILSLCTEYEGESGIHPLDADSRARIEATFSALSADGYRVLAIAYRRVL